jgi:hypothetical protein
VEYLYERKTILQNLVVVLVEMAEENEQKIRELKLAKHFVEVLYYQTLREPRIKLRSCSYFG